MLAVSALGVEEDATRVASVVVGVVRATRRATVLGAVRVRGAAVFAALLTGRVDVVELELELRADALIVSTMTSSRIGLDHITKLVPQRDVLERGIVG